MPASSESVTSEAISAWTARTSAATRSKLCAQLSKPVVPSITRASIRSVWPARRTLPSRR
jgi:hypothetical protein